MAFAKLDKSAAGFAFSISSKKGVEQASFGSGLLCGEDIKRGDACYVKESDGLVYKSGGSGVSALTAEGARVVGLAAEDAYFNSGGGRQQAVTLLRDIDVAYGGTAFSLVPGRHLYLSLVDASKGMLAQDAAALNTPPIAGMQPVAICIDTKRLRILGC